ncbi:hypothetical protein QUF64_01700 [Anaerolineales bacterium HSG6]|nr:hypothetical protein [Anaerolineales bacterium HSG6]MDM8532441.1 hypothetical protein [Anaerolineales bacterium HSG25]
MTALFYNTAMQTNQTPRFLNLGGKLLLVIISGCLTLFILEVTVRLLLPLPYPKDDGQFYQCHADFGWTGRPNYEGFIEAGEYQQQLTFNQLGMHDSDHATGHQTDRYRILMLGDSFVHALQVAENQSNHQRLEDNLNQHVEKTVEVISSGVVNWGTNQQLLYYRKHGREFEPDLVLLMLFIGNDLLDNLPGNLLTTSGINCYAPYFALCADGFNASPLTYAPGISQAEPPCSMSERVLVNSMGWLYQHSRLYQQVEPLLISRSPRQIFGQEHDNPSTALYLPADEPRLEQAWQVTLATIEQFDREVQADGHQFAVALISPSMVVRLMQLNEAAQAQFEQDNPTFKDAQADRPNQRLAEFFQKQGIPYLDLTPALVAHQQANPTPLYFLHDGHWTVEGNRVAAETLSDWFLEQGFVGGKSSVK